MPQKSVSVSFRAAAAVMLSVSLLPAATGRAIGSEQIKDWTIVRQVDALEPKASLVFAQVLAVEKPSQFGRQIKAWLAATCVEDRPGGPWIELSFVFSEPVSLDDRLLRWRIDQTPIQERLSHPQSGRVLAIYSAYGPDPTVNLLRQDAKVLKAEMTLPWAGNVVLTFNVTGAKEALSHIRCKK